MRNSTSTRATPTAVPLRGFSGSLVVRPPGPAAKSSVVDTPVALDSVAATLLGFAGVDAPPGAAQALPVAAAAAGDRSFVAEGAYRGSDLTAARVGRLKAVLEHAEGIRSARLKTAAEAWTRGEMTGGLAIYDLAADPGESLDAASGLEAAERQEVLDVLYGHVRKAEAGLHISCSGVAPEITIDVDEPIARFVPFSWGPDHDAIIEESRRRFRMTAGASGEAWGVLRFTADPESLAVQVNGLAVGADVSADPSFPTVLPDVPCTAWRVSGAGASASLDADEIANLEALGYLGD